MSGAGGEHVSPLERAVAQALCAASRLQAHEAAQVLQQGQAQGLHYGGSYLCGAMIQSGRLRPDEADQLLANVRGGRQQSALDGTIRLPANAAPLPLPAGAPSTGLHTPGGAPAGSGAHSSPDAPSTSMEDDDGQTIDLPSFQIPGAPLPAAQGPGTRAPASQAPRPDPSPSGSFLNPVRPGDSPAGSYPSETGTFGGAPSGTFGGSPGGYGGAPSGAFGGAPSGAFGGAPSGAFGGSPAGFGGAPSGAFDGAPSGAFDGAPSGAFGGAPSGAFGGAPSGAFGGGPSGAFGGAPSGAFSGTPGSTGSAGSSGPAERVSLDLAALGLRGDRYRLDHRPAPGYWEATDLHLERRVVLRVAEAGEAADNVFWRHARVLALLDQPSVREVHDLGTLPQRGPFYCLDPIEGASLEEVVQGERTPALPALLRSLLAVSAALQRAHEQSVVHGRLQPNLVRLGGHGQVWLTGWEHATLLASAEGQVRTLIGPPSPLHPSEVSGLAPELRAGGQVKLTARTDVYGLGRLLYWALAQRLPPASQAKRADWDRPLRERGAPRELIAVARKALSEVPRERYPAARHFADDLRRFLDGKAVLAERDPPLRAALRIARRYPLATSVAGLVALVVLGGASITYRAVRARADRAVESRGEAALAAREAAVRREQAEAQLLLAKERANASKLVREFEVALEAARSGGARGQAGYQECERVLAALAKTKGADIQSTDLVSSLRKRFLLARGRDALFSLSSPRPAKALEDFQALVELDARDPRARFAIYEAARRLPGDYAQQTERDALRALQDEASYPASWAALAEIGDKLEGLEAEAKGLVLNQPPQLLSDTPQTRRLRSDLDVLCGHLGDISQVRTWRGRLSVAWFGPGMMRSRDAIRDGKPAKAGNGGEIQGAWRDLFWAILLDPTDPEPRAVYTRSFFAKWGSHALARHKGGWPLSSLARICRTAQRSEPTLDLVEILEVIGRHESTVPLLERALALPDPQPARDPTLRSLLQLHLARALLRRGQRPEFSLNGLNLPRGYAAQHQLLAAWAVLAEGDLQTAIPALFKAWELAQTTPREVLPVLSDLTLALADPRADPQAMAQAIASVLGPPDPRRKINWVEARFRYAYLVQLSRIPSSAAAQAADREFVQIQAALFESFGGEASTFHSSALLARARAIARLQPSYPGLMMWAVESWSLLNRADDSSERLAGPWRDFVVQLQRELGNRRASEAFALEEPIRELLPRRVYAAPELWDWEGRPGTDGE